MLVPLIFNQINNRPNSLQPAGGMTTVALHFDLFATGFNQISAMDFAEDGRLFVADVKGYVRIVESDGTVYPTLFLDIHDQVGNEGEQALSGFALHPQFETNGRFFVHYTSPDNITYLSRFKTMAADPNQADPTSEEILLTIVQPTDVHNGAGMKFGLGGYLYLGLGDGGEYDDPGNNGQNGLTLLGSILRLDVDSAFPYAIPLDNPYIGNPNVLDEIWDYGLRNPWGFDFDPLTNDFYIPDVGETLWEEINYEPANSGGFNYGWRCYQGFMPYITVGCGPSELYTPPVYVHTHTTMCAIIGGEIYRGSAYPMLDGHFLFADLCGGRFNGLLRRTDGSFTIASSGKINGGFVTTFVEDPAGELFVAANKKIYRISAETVTLTPRSYMPAVRNPN